MVAKLSAERTRGQGDVFAWHSPQSWIETTHDFRVAKYAQFLPGRLLWITGIRRCWGKETNLTHTKFKWFDGAILKPSNISGGRKLGSV